MSVGAEATVLLREMSPDGEAHLLDEQCAQRTLPFEITDERVREKTEQGVLLFSGAGQSADSRAVEFIFKVSEEPKSKLPYRSAR